MEFNKVDINKKQLYEKYVIEENSRSADFAFASIYMWDELYNQSIAISNDMAIVRVKNRFVCPIGNGDFKQAIIDLKEEAKLINHPLVIYSVSSKRLEELKALFSDEFEYVLDRNYCDYVYDIDSLANLTGKKFHQKRNHINQFLSLYNYEFRELNENDFNSCIDILDKWKKVESDVNIENEHKAILRAFDSWDELGLIGGILFVENKPVAFCVGEVVSNNTFCVHFEKVLHEIEGGYPVINKEFANLIKNKCPNIKYINREDDMGLENLRKAKLSYYPELELKYIVTFIDDKIKNQCYDLYINEFKDNQEFVNRLFKEYLHSLRYILLDDEVISMCFEIDAILNRENIKYIYGAVTKDKYRNKGYMNKLLDNIKNEGFKLFLKPGSISLFDFYEKAGFKRISTFQEENGLSNDSSFEVNIIDVKEYLKVRNDLDTKDYILFFESSLNLGNYKYATDYKNYLAVYEINDNRLIVKELIGNKDAVSSIAIKERLTNYTFRYYSDFGDYFGMGYNLCAKFLLALE